MALRFMWMTALSFCILEKSRQVGATVFVHAENGEILNFLRSECVKKGQLTPHFHYVSRPPFTEAEAVRRAIYLAGQTDTPLYIAHMTCREAIAELQKAKGTGSGSPARPAPII